MKKLGSILLIALTMTSCYKEDDYLLSKLNDSFIILSTKNSSILADGVSSTEVSVEIPYNSKKEFNKVVLRTSNGKFENEKQEIEASVSRVVIDGKDKKIAKAKLIASQNVTIVTIEAEIGEITKKTDINFERAYPEKIKTDLPVLTIGYNDQTITLTTKLIRNTGKPSLFSTAKIFVVDPIGNVIGQFLNYSEAVNENGVLTNQFSLGTASCNCQNIFVISETKNANNLVIRDTISLKVK